MQFFKENLDKLLDFLILRSQFIYNYGSFIVSGKSLVTLNEIKKDPAKILRVWAQNQINIFEFLRNLFYIANSVAIIEGWTNRYRFAKLARNKSRFGTVLKSESRFGTDSNLVPRKLVDSVPFRLVKVDSVPIRI